MKVIGFKDASTVLVEMTDYELSTLVGTEVRVPKDYAASFQKLQHGVTFDIRAAWEAVNKIRTAKERVQRLSKLLIAIAEDAEETAGKLTGLAQPEIDIDEEGGS